MLALTTVEHPLILSVILKNSLPIKINKHFLYFYFYWLFLILLFTFNSHAADKQLVHVGDPQNHIASVELIESLYSRPKGDSNTPEKETLIVHLCNGYLTEEQLVVSGRQAKRIRSHLAGKLSGKQDPSSGSRRRIKIFTQQTPRGAAYIDEIPPELLQTKWTNEELVALPLSNRSLVKSTWENLSEIEDSESEVNVSLLKPANLTYDTHFNGDRTLLTLHFHLNESNHCTSKSCPFEPSNIHSFLINKNEGGLFVGIPTLCEEDECPVTRFIKTESQIMREFTYMAIGFTVLSITYFILNRCAACLFN